MLLAAVGSLPVPARADWRLFLPRTLESGAFLDLFAADEKDDSRTAAGRLRWTDTFFKEKLTLFTNGYVYHPRFLQYQLSIAEALKQETYEASFLAPLGRRRGSGLEYDAKLFLLPEHAYTLDLFALRYQPLFKEQFATQHNLVETSRGAGFRYRKKPYFFRARYTDQTVESASSTAEIRQFSSGGEYYARYRNGNSLSLSAAANPSRFRSSTGLDGSSLDTSIGNLLDLQWLRINSLVAKNRLDQADSGGRGFAAQQLSWQELATALLPLHFRTDLSYRYLSNENTLSDESASTARRLSSVNRDLQFAILHRLFQSLDSSYVLRDDSATSAAGDSTTLSHALTFNYTKSISSGRILAGLNLSRSDTDNRGPTDVVDEGHPALAIPGSFQLAQPYADRASLILFLRSPLPPFETIQLQENVHYSVAAVGITFEVTIFALPAQFVVPGSYDFRVTYTLATGSFRLRSDMIGHNASVQLLDDLLTPYYSYSVVRPRVLSGVLPGATFDSSTLAAGLALHVGPARARVEYQDLRWEISPFHAWRADLQYVGSFGPTTSFNATAAYLIKDFFRGRSPDASQRYTEKSKSAAANLQQQLFARRMSVSIGGSYSRIEGLLQNSAYSVNGSLTCRVGKLDLSAGGSAYKSETEGLDVLTNRRLHHYYYLKLRRQLF